jgi:uncharacterized protein (DUF1330 family)
MPKAYWIAHITVDDLDAYQAYRAQVPGIIAAYGAKFLVRGGAQTVVEGAIRPRSVIIEFPSLQAAQDCYNSKQYQAAKLLRTNTSTGDICIIEGWDG